MAPPQVGNQILIPLFDAKSLSYPSTVEWSQNLFTRKAQYYVLTVENITTQEQNAFFIAAELYEPGTAANPKHITRVGETVSGGGHKLTINSSFQYGQKNAQGDLRFLVYHDKERRPYQHRFVETAIGSAVAGKAKEVAEALGQGKIAGDVSALAKNYVGDYLHDF